ncbi:UDP-N-acetylglucosamine 2-epimerase (non-hydrolyzing) [Solihabitans fulvus]|uniref:UDP-N-acetylglucosamine 2-epimerase (non-hydrolyzing) n=1 Tax=Solihabitans fulvus TaxID=1892852 RepID=A0A5B2X655_9PSEU|nr:UDP-N-acetylglucosamine 2-epimerase (non-hydrolyzing) [Solihabitans fulvus]KAA2258837.1 UDP-N-acetylglucosamine 2-epimerase (non-hydrolyzing) [Solihabitans fulvus]
MVGTRPEAVKLAPVAAAMSSAGRLRPLLVATGQHPVMVEQSLAEFGLCPDVTLSLDRVSGRQAELTAQLVAGLDPLFDQRHPAAVVVQGDTTTTLVSALTGYWHQVPVVHLEAGLRSHDLASPFPEEGNRRMVGQIASLHLAPTWAAADNLVSEAVRARSVLTIGNTVVDAVLDIAGRTQDFEDTCLRDVEAGVRAGRSRLVLVTAHRRESWGEPLERVLRAVAELVLNHPDVEVVLPAHPNPAVRAQVIDVLGRLARVTITEPLPYGQLARLLSMATLVLSDSGGIQEEAPSFGVPVLVLREVTERTEAVLAGCARLVGTDRVEIVKVATELLRDDATRRAMADIANPFGDGMAAGRTEQAVAWLLGLQQQRPTEFHSAGHAGRTGGSSWVGSRTDQDG